MISTYTPADVEAGIAFMQSLQDPVLASLPDPDLLVPTTVTEWRSYLTGMATVAVAWREEHPLAYGMGMTTQQADDERRLLTHELAPKHDITAEESGWIDTVAVLPEARGAGLQVAVCEYLHQQLALAGCRQYLTSISPRNEHSIRNFAAMGYRLIETLTLYGGRTRLVMARG